jgi:hypothetical protein
LIIESTMDSFVMQLWILLGRTRDRPCISINFVWRIDIGKGNGRNVTKVRWG